MSTVEVVVPYAGDCPHRRAAWEALAPRYGWPLTVALGGEPWRKAQAVNPVVAKSDADVIVVADADVWHPAIGAAITAVEGGAPWAIPHRGVFRLTRASTVRYLAGEPFEGLALEQRPYLGTEGGGYVVARREVLMQIPLDPRFVGWGQEDESWGFALRTLAGTPWRGKGPLVHLWHPPQQRMTRKVGNPAGRALARRYQRADADAMRQIIAEISCP